MAISQFISKQLPERQKILNNIHEIIIKTDRSIKAKVEPMMGKEMIVYNAPGTFKYGLSSVKKICRCMYCQFTFLQHCTRSIRIF